MPLSNNFPQPAQNMPPSVGDTGATGDVMRYALENHTHASKARKARLQTAADGKVTLAVVHLDADGFVMAPIEPGQRATPVTQTNDILPVITGLKPADLGAGRRVDSAQARAALLLISAFERSPMAGLVAP